MAKKTTETEIQAEPKGSHERQREPVEVRYADQLEALRQNDPDTPPTPRGARPREAGPCHGPIRHPDDRPRGARF